MKRTWLLVLLAAAAVSAMPGWAGRASAVSVRYSSSSPPRENIVRRSHADGRLVVDVWTDRGDGAVYHVGDPIRVHFRTTDDAYVLIYNVDTRGRVHLLFPSRRLEPHWVIGGREYVIPGSRAAYDLVVSGPAGIEYVQALASREPFQQLPDYLDPQAEADDDYDNLEDADWRDGGRIVGDPYVGMERINRSLLPYDCEEEDCYSAAYVNFYVERHVSYPRYLCADCHGPYADVAYDPYASVCPVFEMRVDYDWHWRRNYPFYSSPYWYYFRRANVAPRYYGYKQRWSSQDGWVRFRDTFGERVLWKKNPGYDPKTGGGGGRGPGGGGDGGYFRRGGGGAGGGSGDAGGPGRDRYRGRDGERGPATARPQPVRVPAQQQLAPAPDSPPVRFRWRSRDVAPPPRREPPPGQVAPSRGSENPAEPPRRMERRREEARGGSREEERQREHVKPAPKPDPPPPPQSGNGKSEERHEERQQERQQERQERQQERHGQGGSFYQQGGAPDRPAPPPPGERGRGHHKDF